MFYSSFTCFNFLLYFLKHRGGLACIMSSFVLCCLLRKEEDCGWWRWGGPVMTSDFLPVGRYRRFHPPRWNNTDPWIASPYISLCQSLSFIIPSKARCCLSSLRHFLSRSPSTPSSYVYLGCHKLTTLTYERTHISRLWSFSVSPGGLGAAGRPWPIPQLTD